jgi:hypothetical protein
VRVADSTRGNYTGHARRSNVKNISGQKLSYANVNIVTSSLPHHNFTSLNTIIAVANAMHDPSYTNLEAVLPLGEVEVGGTV